MNIKKILIKILTTAVLMLVLHFLPVKGILRFLLYLILYLFIASDVLKEAFESILDGVIFGESFLMSVATVGALAVGIIYTGDYAEAIAIMLFYKLGELLQDLAVSKSKAGISALLDIRPDYANVSYDGALKKVPPSDISVGTLITVLPGERIPLDGVVTGGQSFINTSALTGESLPQYVTLGDTVVSGCINTDGVLVIRVTKAYADSTVSKILELAQNARSLKSKAESAVSKFARIYTPAVCIGALLLATAVPVVNLMTGGDARLDVWLYRALTFLVASCPCALVVSIPLCFFSAIGGASKEGILIKAPIFIEALSKAQCVAFDKTGTLTKGSFEVCNIVCCDDSLSKEQLLEYAAIAEYPSAHPIAKSIVRAYGKSVDIQKSHGFKEYGSLGVLNTVNGVSIAAGKAELMEKLGIVYRHAETQETAVHVAAGGKYAGYITVSDMPKESSKEAVKELRRIGVKRTLMLTGDSNKAAAAAASNLGIDEVFAELMPADKAEKIENLKSSLPDGATVIFAGDGINDTPVLAAADVGIAMGALGSDAAVEAADAVLMDDDVRKIGKAIRISRKCMRIVCQNTVLAITVKLIALILAVSGNVGMWFAVFADTGITVITVLNSIRALFVKKA